LRTGNHAEREDDQEHVLKQVLQHSRQLNVDIVKILCTSKVPSALALATAPPAPIRTFENRLRMRPFGVESKKVIGARITFANT